jgi:hypothetical protein
MPRTLGLIVALVASGCTTLGPMPAATAVAPVPLGRPAAEVGVALVPGYFMSSGVARVARGTAVPQLSALLEPDRWLGVPGLIAGARLVGTDQAGTFFEPLLGYRHRLDRVGLGVVG